MDIEYLIKPRRIRAARKRQFAKDLREIAEPIFRHSGSGMYIDKIEMVTELPGYKLEELTECTIVFNCHQWLDTRDPVYPPDFQWLKVLGLWARNWGYFEEGQVKIKIHDIGYSEITI